MRNNYDYQAYHALLEKQGFSWEAISAMESMAGGREKFIKFCRAGKFNQCREYYDTLDALEDLGIPLPEIGAIPDIGTVRERALHRLIELKEKFDICFNVYCCEKHVVIYLPSLKKLNKVKNSLDIYDLIEE